ncbi:hypothetical protein TXYLGN1_17820 [Tepidimicrobium xylanilyticum]
MCKATSCFCICDCECRGSTGSSLAQSIYEKDYYNRHDSKYETNLPTVDHIICNNIMAKFMY